MKYGRSRVAFVDKDLNLITSQEHFDNICSGSCSIKKEPFCKKGGKFKNGLSSDGLEQGSEKLKEVV